MCERDIYITDTLAHDRSPLQKRIVLLWSEFFSLYPSGKVTGGCCCFLFVRQFYTVFSSALLKQQAFSGLTNSTAEWQKWPELIFMIPLWLFPVQAYTVKPAVLDAPYCDNNLRITFKGYSGFQRGAWTLYCKYIFQLLGSVILHVMYLYMCIYTQIILHTKKRSAHEFTLGMPTN